MPYKPLRELKPELFADEKEKLAMLAIEDPVSEDDPESDVDASDDPAVADERSRDEVSGDSDTDQELSDPENEGPNEAEVRRGPRREAEDGPDPDPDPDHLGVNPDGRDRVVTAEVHMERELEDDADFEDAWERAARSENDGGERGAEMN